MKGNLTRNQRGGMRGWGLLLLLLTPLLIFFSFSQLKDRESAANLERFNTSGGADLDPLTKAMLDYFKANRSFAVAGQLKLPPVPAKSTVKTWQLREDGVAVVELNILSEGEKMILKLVPLASNSNPSFECGASAVVARKLALCSNESLKTEAEIQDRLAQNDVFLKKNALTDASGAPLPAGMAAGSVFVTPENKTKDCGYQCVKSQSCASPRALACSRIVREGNASRFEIKAVGVDLRASQIASRAEADKMCGETGADFRLASAGSIWHSGDLSTGQEYWVHNDVNTSKNCWAN